MFIQWVVITGVAGAFFTFASRSAGPTGGVPIGVCFGFPAVVFGIGQLVRFARES
jgi:hypothetical protein